MEAFGIIGMTLGSSGFIFGIIAFTQASALRSELEKLKSTLRASGALDEPNAEK